MARPLRIEYPGACYHLTARGNSGNYLFLDQDDRSNFLKLLAREIQQQGWKCFAYCLMDNHYHLLIQTPERNLVSGMRRLNGVFTQKFNRRHGRYGHLFQGRYKSILVDQESYLLELCRYVVLNPVRAGMVKSAKDWKWSSYRQTAGIDNPPFWLDVKWALDQFHKNPKKARNIYRTFVAEGVGLNSPWKELRGQIWLGEDGFLEKMEKLIRNKPLEEIPRAQTQPRRPTKNEVIRTVGREFQVREGALWSRENPRAYEAAAYLLRRVVNLKLREVSELFGVSGGRISKIQRKIETGPVDRRLNKLLVGYKVKN